ncbi:MAG: cation:proton antiporter [Candidatus Omnitrophica bacterium]|nr:cation:proton antiporter [Candidatus Omnitrophota bacterium]
MNSILIAGIIVSVGFLFGEIAQKIKLPKITGYIIAGVLLNPGIVSFIPKNFPEATNPITNIALAFITFSIGGSLLYSNIKKLGKGMLLITLFEAEFAFLAIAFSFILFGPMFLTDGNPSWLQIIIPMGLLLGCLGSPTDPSATLAIKQEYKPVGDVSETMLGVAAFDDVLGIINYSVAVVIAAACATSTTFSVGSVVIQPIGIILGSVALGVAFGVIFNRITDFITKESEGVHIVVVFGLLTSCFGLCQMIGTDALLAIMTLGAIVVNFNKKQDQIFKLMERYVDELIFILFFTLSGMHLNFSVLFSSGAIVLLFVVFRTIGKFTGTFVGATIAKAPENIRKYTIGGLIPQGGIVIGLALVIRQNPAFYQISDIIISVVIGSTVIHEIVGPICAKIALQKAGEISK